MSVFGNLTTEGMEETGDVLGGGSGAFDAGIYLAKVKMLYATTSAKGAKGAVVILDINGREYRETIWMTSQAGKNYYHPKIKGSQERDTSKKVPLPGFVTVNELAQIAVGKEINSVNFDEKKVKEYDFDLKKDKLVDASVATELQDTEILVAIKNTLENKTKEVNGSYVATNETRTVNTIEKVAHPTKRMTVSEAREKAEPAFMDAWDKKNSGKVHDKTVKSDVKSGSPAGNAGGDSKPAKSLFDDE